MKQLSLNIIPRLPYSTENFYLHAGISKHFHQGVDLLARPKFGICYFRGGKRSGKTHLCIRMSDELAMRGLYPRIVEGEHFLAWATHFEAQAAGEVILVDDAHLYLSQVNAGEAGPFVTVIEKLRVANVPIAFFSLLEIEDLPCDEHVKSRLLPGAGFCLANPDEQDMTIVLRCMARQRGIFLSEKKVRYLEKRLNRDVASIENYLERASHLAKVVGGPYRLSLLGGAL